MALFKIPRSYLLLSSPHTYNCRYCLRFSSATTTATAAATNWYSLPPTPQNEDPKLSAISHAIKNHSQSLDSSSSLRKLLPSLTARDVINLINLNPHSLSPLSVLSFFDWLSSHPTFRHTVQSYCSMAHFLCAHQMYPQALSLLRLVVSRRGKDSVSSVFASILETRGTHQSNYVFDALMNAYLDSGFVSDAFQCFRLIRKHNFRIPFHVCGCLLDKMLKLNSPVVAWEYFLEILDAGFPPKVYAFNVLMHKMCKEGKIEQAQMVFDEIGKRGLRPSVVSFNTLINGYCKSGNLEEGFRLKRDMEESRTWPDVYTYSVLINGLCKECRLDDANLLFDEMCERGLVPNFVTFTTLIDGQCKNGRIDLAMEIYQKMLGRGIKPDVITYNTLINGLCKVGDLREARKLVEEMNMTGVKPDTITYTTLIDGCCKEGDLHSALEIRQGMIIQGIKIDNVAFTALISGLCREGRTLDAEKMLREMLDSGMKPDDATYTMVIDGFCKKGNVKMGFKLLKEMQSDDYVPSVVTYNALMNGLCKLGQMKNANMLLQAMINLGVAPDDITYNILLEGHCKHGNPEDFEKLRSEKGLALDYASYTSLVSKFNKSSKDLVKMGAENVGHRRPHSEDSGVVLTGTANAKEGNGGLVDIGESKDAYLVRVALAGLQTNRGNVKCVIQRDGKVHIQGVMNGVELLKNSSTVYHMRAQQLSSPGPFTLSFRLPGPVDPRLFSPHFQHDGILEIVVLKSSKLSKN
ncbi:unnamed protein product [Malus baccata var. baccata]